MADTTTIRIVVPEARGVATQARAESARPVHGSADPRGARDAGELRATRYDAAREITSSVEAVKPGAMYAAQP